MNFRSSPAKIGIFIKNSLTEMRSFHQTCITTCIDFLPKQKNSPKGFSRQNGKFSKKIVCILTCVHKFPVEIGNFIIKNSPTETRIFHQKYITCTHNFSAEIGNFITRELSHRNDKFPKINLSICIPMHHFIHRFFCQNRKFHKNTILSEATRNMPERIARSKIQQSRHQTLFIPKEGREYIDKIQGKKKLVRKSVMQGECIITPHIHGTPWEPF